MGVFWLILVSVEGWTYHFDNVTKSWNETREWCQKDYTDIVVVQNENVTHFLTKYLPKRTSLPYYWIGLKKINDSWTWVANEEIVNYENWAANEPNNAQSDESCVELYISTTNKSGKWNDDKCSNKKYPVCHKAQCLSNSCSGKGLCKEQVNNFTCECEPGFSGPQCQTVVSCEELSAPQHGWMKCSGLYGNHSFNSSCTFSCVGGYKLRGTAEIKCNSSGAWNAPPPSCAVVSCEELSAPQHGWMKCSGLYGNHSLNSSCTFSCVGGYKLRGTAEIKCNSSGAWNAPPPSCAVECFPLFLFGGGLMNCTKGPDGSRSDCRVQCPPGQLLLGFAEFTCRADGMWESSFPLMCASFVHFLIALLASVVISVFCGCFCCSICRKKLNRKR
ncbi:L-selectin-like [Pseudorasbora parva]|uniref:L-selectin-like n=1 Tax=Pseudorasbora parva TaxID=51549 RepID=UPI00351E58FB